MIKKKRVQSDNLKRKKLERKIKIKVNQDKMDNTDNMNYAYNEKTTFQNKQL